MSDLKVTKAIMKKIKEYAGNKAVEKALTELFDELSSDYHGLEEPVAIYGAVFEVDREPETYKTYDVYANCKNLSKANKLSLCRDIRKEFGVSFADAVNALKEDEALVLNDVLYKEALEKKKELDQKGVESRIAILKEEKIDYGCCCTSMPVGAQTAGTSPDPYEEMFYDVAIKTSNLSNKQKEFIVSLLRKRMDYSDARKYIDENDEVIALQIVEDDMIDMYKEVFDSKGLQFRLIEL